MQRLPASPTPSLSSGEAEPEFERVDRAAQASTSTSASTSTNRPFPKFKWPWKRKRVLPELEEENEGGRISVDIAERCDLFAKEVCVSGWKIVGGKSFGDVARVGAYVAYDVEIALRSGATITISRRYTRFAELRRDLEQAYPHLANAIPPLPGKTHMSKFSPEFLEERRPRLQRFLRAVMLHPEMGVGGDTVVGRWVLAK